MKRSSGRTKKPAVVVDTNVLHVANGNSHQAALACVEAVVNRLERVQRTERVVLDDCRFILNEYIRQHFKFSGQPGLGDAFFKWVFDNQANESVCECVQVTARNEAGTDFAEFPDDVDLRGFDLSDRKFVAVAITSPSSPCVLNAVDSDWWDFRIPLERNGIQVEFLCGQLTDA